MWIVFFLFFWNRDSLYFLEDSNSQISVCLCLLRCVPPTPRLMESLKVSKKTQINHYPSMCLPLLYLEVFRSIKTDLKLFTRNDPDHLSCCLRKNIVDSIHATHHYCIFTKLKPIRKVWVEMVNCLLVHVTSKWRILDEKPSVQRLQGQRYFCDALGSRGRKEMSKENLQIF